MFIASNRRENNQIFIIKLRSIQSIYIDQQRMFGNSINFIQSKSKQLRKSLRLISNFSSKSSLLFLRSSKNHNLIRLNILRLQNLHNNFNHNFNFLKILNSLIHQHFIPFYEHKSVSYRRIRPFISKQISDFLVRGHSFNHIVIEIERRELN